MLSLPWFEVSGARVKVSFASAIPIPCSLAVPLSELGLEVPGSGSLELLVLVGFVLGEFAGEAVTGGSR